MEKKLRKCMRVCLMHPPNLKDCKILRRDNKKFIPIL